jgi:hypothetical protein
MSRRTEQVVLVPGSYVRVTFSVPRDDAPLVLSGSTLAMRGGASLIALVEDGQKVRFVPVKITRELGREVEVVGDLTADSTVVLYPPASLQDGDTVTLATEVARPK